MTALPPTPAMISIGTADSVGSIHVRDDRSIVLRFRIEYNTGTDEAPSYAVGEGYRIIKPEEADYAAGAPIVLGERQAGPSSVGELVGIEAPCVWRWSVV